MRNYAAEDIDFKEATSPHDVCGALKHYLRESPVPLIPFENYSSFVSAGRTLLVKLAFHVIAADS